jgi:uncharacterized glyoxalase superfamily protein PhnB
MPGSNDHPSILRSPRAVGLRVADVRRAAEFYQTIGFTFVMAIPGESERWVLCMLKYGSRSILLAPLDHLPFPLSNRLGRLWSGRRGLGVRVDLAVTDISATYRACTAAGCQVTEDPVQEICGDYAFSCLDPFGYEWRFTQVAERERIDRPARAANAIWS